MVQQAQRIYRSREERLLFGVAGGLAEYFDVDPVLIRMGWVLLAVATVGIALLFYIVLAIIVPRGRGQPVSEFRHEGESSGSSSDSVMDAEPDRGPTKRHVARNVLGIGLIVVGLIVLLHHLDVIESIRWDVFWPVGIVLLGITILRPTLTTLTSKLRISRGKSRNTDSGDNADIFTESEPDQDTSKSNLARNVLGIGLIVVGIIILLHQLDVIESIRWDIVWPVGIVLVGLSILLPSVIESRR